MTEAFLRDSLRAAEIEIGRLRTELATERERAKQLERRLAATQITQTHLRLVDTPETVAAKMKRVRIIRSMFDEQGLGEDDKQP